MNGKLVVYLDVDGEEGLMDRFETLVADGPITSIDDFEVVDDGSGTFTPKTNLYVTNTDFIL